MTSATYDVQRTTGSEARLSVVLMAVAVNAWAILSLLRQVPSLMLHLTLLEIVGVAGYVLSSALLETVLLSLPIALVGLALSRLKRHVHLAIYVAAGLISLVLWLLPCEHRWPINVICHPAWPWLGPLLLLSWLGLAAMALRRYPERIERTYVVLHRLEPLAAIYLGIDIVAVLVTLIRYF